MEKDAKDKRLDVLKPDLEKPILRNPGTVPS